jgi:tetratricopeptide (TPR) repeat protein
MAHINSRYTIIRTLGDNPHGGVFLAEDSLFGKTRIALKTLPSHSIDSAHLTTLRDEFLTLSRFKHPNIAQVFDFGTIHSTDMPGYEGAFFFTLEYFEGKDLFQFTADKEADCFPELAYQIAHALAYIHRHQLIHFDIKPSNIMVTNAIWGDDTIPLVKIIDFGFASSTIASLEQPIRGTLDYIAPELLRGDPYDERIDLYSLGASLYEIAERATPFKGDAATSIVKQHLTSPLPVPGRKDLPAVLNALIAGLLQKDPGLRIRSAASVIERLHGSFARESQYRSVLIHIPVHCLAGRENEVKRLQRFLVDGLAEGTPQGGQPAQFIIGETGIGKTSLLHEVRRRSQASGTIVFDTQCFARIAEPYEPFLKILRDQIAYVRSFGTRGDALLALHAEFLSAALGTDEPYAEAHRRFGEPERRLHFVDQWANLFYDIASFTPYAVIVDDIDNADESTIELFQYILRSAGMHRVKFLVTGASGSLIIPQLQTHAAQPAEVLTLEALDEPAVEELMCAFLDLPDVPRSLASAVTQRIGGSPYILREFLSQYAGAQPETLCEMIAEDIQHPSGTFAYTISQMYEQKMSKRKPEELFLMRLMSCFDAPVPMALLAQLSPFSPQRLKYFLDLLGSLGIVRSLENGGRWHLAQSQFQSFIYSGLGTEQAMLHGLIAETMVKGGSGAPQNAEAIANHFKRAGENRKAYAYFVEAAELKRAHFAIHESIALLNEACSVIPSEEADLSVFEHLAQAYSQAGDYKNAVILYGQLRMDADCDAKRYMYAKELGLIHNREGQLDNAVECLSEASRLARTAEETIDVEEELTIIDMSRGRYTDAYERCMNVLKTNTAIIESVAITGILNNLGIIHFYQNHFDDAAACFHQSVSILEREGEKSKLIGPFLNLGNVHGAQGHFADAEEYWQHALLLAQEVGNLQQEARAYNNIGIAAFNQGNHDDASLYYEKAFGIFSRLGLVPGMALCLTNIGEVHLADVDYERAIECWEKDLQLYTALQDEHGMTEIDLQLAGVHLALGRTRLVNALLDDAEALIGADGVTAQHALFHYVKGCLDLSCDAHHTAREHLVRARLLFGEARDERSFCLASLRLAEAEDALHHDERAVTILDEVRRISVDHRYPLLEAEALSLLGECQARQPVEGQKSPILLYLHAFEVIQTQNVTEITWQICHRLGMEFLKRGLHDKGRLYLTYARQSLEYIGNRITSDALRGEYYASCRRGELLGEIRATLEAEEGM